MRLDETMWRPPIGAEVVVEFGQEQIITTVKSVEVVRGRGVTYTLVGTYDRWEVMATATHLELTSAPGEPWSFHAGGEIELHIVTSIQGRRWWG